MLTGGQIYNLPHLFENRFSNNQHCFYVMVGLTRDRSSPSRASFTVAWACMA